MTKSFKKNREKGFSFLEVMLVVFILGTALVVFIQVITKSIGHSTGSRDTIIAAGLAQEGVELVKNLRDDNWAHKRGAFEVANFPSGDYCNIDYGGFDCSLVNYALKLNNGFYEHGYSGSDTKFSRRIAVSGNGGTRTVTSYVTWGDPNFLNIATSANCDVSHKCIYAQIILTKWGGE